MQWATKSIWKWLTDFNNYLSLIFFQLLLTNANHFILVKLFWSQIFPKACGHLKSETWIKKNLLENSCIV